MNFDVSTATVASELLHVPKVYITRLSRYEKLPLATRWFLAVGSSAPKRVRRTL